MIHLLVVDWSRNLQPGVTRENGKGVIPPRLKFFRGPDFSCNFQFGQGPFVYSPGIILSTVPKLLSPTALHSM